MCSGAVAAIRPGVNGAADNFMVNYADGASEEVSMGQLLGLMMADRTNAVQQAQVLQAQAQVHAQVHAQQAHQFQQHAQLQQQMQLQQMQMQMQYAAAGQMQMNPTTIGGPVCGGQTQANQQANLLLQQQQQLHFLKQKVMEKQKAILYRQQQQQIQKQQHELAIQQQQQLEPEQTQQGTGGEAVIKTEPGEPDALEQFSSSLLLECGLELK